MSELFIRLHECPNCTADFHAFTILCQVKKRNNKRKETSHYSVQCPGTSLSVICRRTGFPPSKLVPSLPWSGSAGVGKACLAVDVTQSNVSFPNTEQANSWYMDQLETGGSRKLESFPSLVETECHVLAQSLPSHYSWEPVWEMYCGRLVVWIASFKKHEYSGINSQGIDHG